jgi:hypothetical protein
MMRGISRLVLVATTALFALVALAAAAPPSIDPETMDERRKASAIFVAVVDPMVVICS